MFKTYDVIVVGAGHAGCEAAAAAANMGCQVLLVTMDMTKMAQMSCNPAMGGIAKGQILREIDAIGGYSGIVSDRTAIQFRMLNRSKGPAMWSPRTQNDREMFTNEWRKILEGIPNVHFWQDNVVSILIEGNEVCGVLTGMGERIRSKSVILTSGTFLNGVIHIGEKHFGGGRVGESSSSGITEQLVSLGFRSGRMKTGTPPRVDGRSLDFSKMEIQEGDSEPAAFSFLENTSPLLSASNKDGKAQRPCFITYTNEVVHDVLREGFERSPMFKGRITGLGPRYCPSIEDKINRFAERDRHQLFVEPEGWETIEYYVNGFSTSLPEEIQHRALSLVPGFENVRFFRPGYAIEYDYFPPEQLYPSLETKPLQGLYFAGQINGTTGYEEAACQGLIAGTNAALKIRDQGTFILKRSEAYIGVLIDDLVTKGTEEPYRMFTSRAEYRILLRQDNADERLTSLSHAIGLASEERMRAVEYKYKRVEEIVRRFKNESVSPEQINPRLAELGNNGISQKTRMFNIITRPDVRISDFNNPDICIGGELLLENNEILGSAEIRMKYEGYIEKESNEADKLKRLEGIVIAEDFDYSRLTSLSTEARQKMAAIRPRTIGQASRISGVNPSDISVLMVYLGR